MEIWISLFYRLLCCSIAAMSPSERETRPRVASRWGYQYVTRAYGVGSIPTAAALMVRPKYRYPLPYSAGLVYWCTRRKTKMGSTPASKHGVSIFYHQYWVTIRLIRRLSKSCCAPFDTEVARLRYEQLCVILLRSSRMIIHFTANWKRLYIGKSGSFENC